MVIAAVADGCGSEEHSEVASKIAAEVSTSYCEQNISSSSKLDEILGVIKASFEVSQKAIEKEAEAQGHSIDQYDTTLSLAVFVKDTLYYGHSGDSGIVVQTTEGRYENVTNQQRDEYGKVFYLAYRDEDDKDKWVFGQFDKKVCSVFLATDGIYETLFPFLIRNEPVNIHVNLALFFMDNRSLNIDKEGEDAVQERIANYIKNIPDEKVNDDKTVVVLVNTSVKSELQPDDYYKEPDWAELERKRKEEWKREAYPHLFKDKPTDVLQQNIAPVDDTSKVENDVNSSNADQSVDSADNAITTNDVADASTNNEIKEPQSQDKIYESKGKKTWISRFLKK
jgi:serine/threonine protein phosphatase PrpC